MNEIIVLTLISIALSELINRCASSSLADTQEPSNAAQKQIHAWTGSGIVDCSRPGAFACENDWQLQISPYRRCDGFSDCSDHSDELNCTECQTPFSSISEGQLECKLAEAKELRDLKPSEIPSCPTETTRCAYKKPLDKDANPVGNSIWDVCLPNDFLCDGREDCPEGDDEKTCSKCNRNAKICLPSRKCIHASLVCDGHVDCVDGSDEKGCTCEECFGEDRALCSNGQCIRINKLCDGVMDCKDGSDEKNCPGVCSGKSIAPFNPPECESPFFFYCNSGRCIPREKLCNNFKDCRLREDEKSCKIKWKCALRCDRYNKCVRAESICDGLSDCFDGSDERGCLQKPPNNNYSPCELASIPFCSFYSLIPPSWSPRKLQCPVSTFACFADHRCLSMSVRCNGRRDCSDGSDESCSCEECAGGGGYLCEAAKECISRSKVCSDSHLSNCPDATAADRLFCHLPEMKKRKTRNSSSYAAKKETSMATLIAEKIRKMRIGRHAGWRRALLLLSTLPLLIEAQSAYDFETQPIQPSFSPRGYQPPPQPARYPVPAPAPRFQPHQSVGYQPPPQPAQYETNNDRYPQHYYRPVTPQRPAPASQYHQEPAQQSYEAVPVQQQPHRPAPAYHQATRPAYEQPQATAAYRVPEPARPAPQYHPAPAYESVPEQPRPTASRPAPPYHPAPAYESVPEQPQPVPRRPAPAYHPEPARPAYESTAQQPAPHRPASQPPPPVHYRPATPSYHHEPAPPSYEPEPQQPRPTVHRPASAHHPEPARPSYEPEPYDTLPIPYEPAPHQPQQQRPTGLPRQPPAIAPMGTFGPAPGTQPGGDGEGLNVMIHVFINEKQRQGVTTQAPGPAAPPHPLPPHLAGMHFPHSSMPLTFTRDFDRTKNRFLADDEEEEEQEGPANIVEIKAVVDSSDAAMDMRIGKAMAKELDRAVPVILGKLPDKTSRLDEGLRNQLEQELISEISKNLGGHLEQNTDVTEKELSDLIDQGFKELEEDSTPQHTPATHPVRLETTTRPAAAAPAHMTTLQPVQPSRPATTAATTRPSAPPATSASASPAATTETQQPQTRPSATPGAPAPASRAPSPPASSTATAGQSTAAATERPTQQQPTAPAATTAPTQPTAPPATVQWWLPTTAAPAEEAAAPAAAQQHATAPSTTAPVPPVATMRTFPTEALPLPVTQPTLKVPESEEEKSGEINEMPFHHQGEEFPTEQPAQPMHESTSTSNQATTVPGTRPVPSVTTKTPTPSTQPTEPTTLPGTRPVPTTQPTEETTMPGTRPAATQPTAAHEKEETVPSAPPDINVETTMPASSTESSMESAQATTLPGTTVTEPSTVPSTAPGTASESMPASKPAEVTTEATTESSASSVPVSATTEPSGTKSTTEPSGTQAPVTKTKEEEEADEVSLDDLISAIEDGLNDEEKKKLLDASKEKSAEETTTTTTGETTTATTSSSATKSELEKELEHELSKELEETSELADELSKTLSKELKSEESTTSSELTDTLSKTLSKELGKSEESVKSSEVSDALSKTLSKELEKSEETTVTSSELADELSKTISKELEKSEETELEKALSTELEKNIEEGKSIETLIHEGEEAFEKLEKEKATEKPEVTKKPEVETSTTVIAPTKEFNHEEMPFEGKDVFGTMNETVKAKEEEKKPTSECSMARDLSDTTKADVLFLLDSSNTFNQEKFRGALELIANTTEHFKNIGPDGVQVSLIQFASEPQLEFSLRRHNCLPTLIEDIKGTEHLKGASMLGHAIDKATRLAFTRERGDRPDAENLLIVVTDGVTEDKVQHPVTVAKENGVGVLVISTIEADPDVVLELAGTADNVFKMDGKITEPLSSRLAQRIRTTAASYHIPEQRFPVINGNMDESAEAKNKGEEEGAKKPIEEGASTTELPSTIKSGEVTQEMLPPPKNLKLQCTRKSLGINIELPGSFHGWLFIEGQREKENCSMKVEKEEGKTFRPVHFEAGIEECDIAHIQSDQPAGINSSAVVSIVKHPKAVSIDDKAYLLECFVASALETTLDAHLEVVGGIKKTIAEAFSLDVVPPKCHYTIRKGSPEGVEVEKADLGEVVFHRWDCDGGDEAYDVFGMHIHDCYASSDVEQQFPILDSNGCSSNTNLLSPPVYADGALSVYAESRAFAVENDQQDLKFQCKVSLCTRDGDGCEGITPPHCSGNATDLLVSRRLRHNQAVDSALTSAVATSVGLTTAAVSRYSPGLVVLIAIILATAIGLISAVRLKSCRTRRASRPIVTSPSMEDIYVTVPGRAPIRTTITPRHPAMTDFMKDFDRSRYV